MRISERTSLYCLYNKQIEYICRFFSRKQHTLVSMYVVLDDDDDDKYIVIEMMMVLSFHIYIVHIFRFNPIRIVSA